MDKFDTLEYSWVKATAASVRLRIYLFALTNANNWHCSRHCTAKPVYSLLCRTLGGNEQRPSNAIRPLTRTRPPSAAPSTLRPVKRRGQRAPQLSPRCPLVPQGKDAFQAWLKASKDDNHACGHASQCSATGTANCSPRFGRG